ncbi:MAG: 2OG-Fe(II) oxygenase [Candidatus Competibacteraceae bacterium]|nr:2OG-Fe(II) oxygenase [Candidatus Competibacteraceae bacterium]
MSAATLIAIAGAVAFVALKRHQRRRYRRLEARQRDLVIEFGQTLTLPDSLPDPLPDFRQRIAVIPRPLPAPAFEMLRQAALRCRQTERSYFPAHKQGGAVAYEELHRLAPEIVVFYQSAYLRRLCSAVVEQPVVPTPINDQSSCSLLFYDRPGDHIGWHYDHNFYDGRHFTVLLSLVNGHLIEDRLSSARLMIRREGREIAVPTPPNALVVFEGARVFHKVTRLEADERRIVLSMTFCTRPHASVVKGVLRRCKDVAYFGVRALWT